MSFMSDIGGRAKSVYAGKSEKKSIFDILKKETDPEYVKKKKKVQQKVHKALHQIGFRSEILNAAMTGDAHVKPSATWAAQDLLGKIGAGNKEAAQLLKTATGPMKNSLKNAAGDIGRKIVATIPVAGEIVAGLEIARGVPGVGPIVDQGISAIAGLADPGKLFSMAKAFISDIPVLGDLIGSVEDVLGSIPGVSEVAGAIEDIAGGVGDVLGSVFPF